MTVEGKVDVTLIGISRYDATDKKAIKELLTNENVQYSWAKSLLVVTLLYDKRTTTECPVCKEVRELQEKEEEALRKEWKDQQTGYKN